MSEVILTVLVFVSVITISPAVGVAYGYIRERRQPNPFPAPPVEMYGDLRLSEIRTEWAIKQQEKELRRLGVTFEPFDLSPSTREWLKDQREKKQAQRRRTTRAAPSQTGFTMDEIARAFQRGILAPDEARAKIDEDQRRARASERDWVRRIADDQLAYMQQQVKRQWMTADGLPPRKQLDADAAVNEAERIVQGE